MSPAPPSAVSVTTLKGVGAARAKLLARLGINTIRDALFYFPTRYEDRRQRRNICDVVPGSVFTVEGEVLTSELMDLRRGRGGHGGMKLLEVVVTDGTGRIKCKWFNQPYLKDRFRKGARVSLSALVKPPRFGRLLEMENPDYEAAGSKDDAHVHTARAVPVYRTTEELSAKQLRAVINAAMDTHLGSVADYMPEDLLQRLALPPLAESIRNTHYPPDDADLAAFNAWRTPWQRRLSFDELFMLEAGFAALRRGVAKKKGIPMRGHGGLVSDMRRALPFELTRAQERVCEEILREMAEPHPMQRLVQGDVGSGKTLVALVAMLTAVECGYQAALMAPTEILAEQHYANIEGMAGGLGMEIRLLTGSTRGRPCEGIADGSAHIVVGTHALIQEGVEFKALGLAVIDEQHRFGVRQRAELRTKGINPHVLIMTATPIPRTLAMSVHGDLGYSVIDELPPGRRPVETTLVMHEDRARAYDAIRSELASGGQVYVVYPLIEESEKTDLRSAETGAAAMTTMFPGARVALVHGRMKQAEKESAMSGFKAGEIDILVSTTVIEVGVDVPNASLMVVVHAERFGLSQLHQLRGRVGRGRRASRCMLLAYGPLGEESSRRLGVICATNDGFRIAEEDLAIRGPGELLGTRQSGLPDLRVADIMRDAPLLAEARREAFAMMDADPEFAAHPALRREVEAFWRGRVEVFSTG